MADFTLRDVDITAVSLCKGPATRFHFILKKSEGEPALTLPAPHTLIKEAGEDWSVVYAVVAAPEHEEQAGVGAGAQPGKTDVWESADEIRGAAHRFLKNGGLINKHHEDLEPYGQLVENFIAPVDMEINGQSIKAGSWCIGIEPTEEGRALIDSGEWDGVSYEGTGQRVPVHKGDPAPAATYGVCDNCKGRVTRGQAKCQNCGKAVTIKKAKVSAEAVSQAHGPILNLVSFYMKKKHPFAACVRDNRKRFGPGAEAVCARLKDIGHGGSTDWRKGPSKIKKAEDLPFELIDTMSRNWLEAGLTVEDATMAAQELMESADRTLLQKIADALGISTENDDPGTTGEEAKMTDEQTAQLAKVEGLESQIEDLTKDGGRLATIEAGMEQILARLPEPQKDPAEEREELVKAMDKLEEDHAKLLGRFEKLTEGDTDQDGGPDDLHKSDDPEAQLAHALLG